jgi:uncharacterized protein (TIGR02118 family)
MLLAGVAAGTTAATEAAASAASPVTGAVKLTVLYGHPPDPEAFEKYYLGVHMPLVRAMKGHTRMEASKGLPQADGSPPPFYRVFEIWFGSQEQMAAAFKTPEGKKVGADAKNFAEGTTMTLLVSKLD